MNSILTILCIGSPADYFQVIDHNKKIVLLFKENNLEATHYLNSNKAPEAIICNYNLPGNNGLFLFDWIRDHSEYNSIPFVLLVKEFNSRIYKLAIQKRVDDFYVTSVTNPLDLLSRIEFLCLHKKASTAEKLPLSIEESYRMPVSKRLFDIVVASSVLLLATPFFVFILLAIKLESKGKVYYISKRVGRKTFDFYKLRSMRTGSDTLLQKLAQDKNQYRRVQKPANTLSAQPCPRCSKLAKGETCSPTLYIDSQAICDYWFNSQKTEAAKTNSTFVKIVDDPRVTRVGKFIRNTSIDELPQLINVLKGDMSIVGNRPLPVYEAELLTADSLSKRFLAPAGITGLWQVELRGKGGCMSEEERMRLDNEYADHFKGGNFSFWYDIQLILRTLPALIQKGSV